MTTVIIGADHLGVELKNSVTEHLKSKGHEVVDIGVNSHDPVDYPDVGRKLAERVAAKEFDRGILICGTRCRACAPPAWPIPTRPNVPSRPTTRR